MWLMPDVNNALLQLYRCTSYKQVLMVQACLAKVVLTAFYGTYLL